MALNTENKKVHHVVTSRETVRQSLISILDSMQRIREECITERTIPEKLYEEYSHLSYRASAGILDYMKKDELFSLLLNRVLEQLNVEPALINYDPLQHLFWEKKAPEFELYLDGLLAIVMLDSFDGHDKSHHILQGLKMMLSSATSKTEILLPTPVIGGVDQNVFKQLGIENEFMAMNCVKRSRFEATVSRDFEFDLLDEYEGYMSSHGYCFHSLTTNSAGFRRPPEGYFLTEKIFSEKQLRFLKRIAFTDYKQLPSVFGVHDFTRKDSITLDELMGRYSTIQNVNPVGAYLDTGQESYVFCAISACNTLNIVQAVVHTRKSDNIVYALMSYQQELDLDDFSKRCIAEERPGTALERLFTGEPMYAKYARYEQQMKIHDIFTFPKLQAIQKNADQGR